MGTFDFDAIDNADTIAEAREIVYQQFVEAQEVIFELECNAEGGTLMSEVILAECGEDWYRDYQKLCAISQSLNPCRVDPTDLGIVPEDESAF